ncbi:MAG: HIT family protein [Gammaproteobacteria bacterium]|nr:HIT family protein [Gammaproteobacteria bacterium]
MNDCVFCSIISKKIECSLVYEDAHTICFVPLDPENPGHVLVMPRNHYEDIFSTPPLEIEQLMVAARLMANAILKAVTPKRVALVAMGLDVQHAHFHLVPINSRLDITSKRQLAGEVITRSKEELDRQAALIRQHL